MERMSFVVHDRSQIKFAIVDDSVDFISVFLKDDDEVRESLNRFDLVFCPGNSFGHMTGGFDQGVVDVYGSEVETTIRQMIATKYFGMMPVGRAEVVVVNGRGFVYTPTMFVPTQFTDVLLPYMSMYSSLVAVHEYERKNGMVFKKALCPLYCVGTGGAVAEVALRQQRQALLEFKMALVGANNGCADLFKDGMKRYMNLAKVSWHD
jgi:hypothetical protein